MVREEEADRLVRRCVRTEAVASVANASVGRATRAILAKMVMIANKHN